MPVTNETRMDKTFILEIFVELYSEWKQQKDFGSKKCGAPKIQSFKTFGPKDLGYKEFLGSKKFGSKMKLGLRDTFDPKFCLGPMNSFLSKNIFWLKNVWYDKNLVRKLWVKKIFDRQKFQSKRICVQK